MDSPRLRLGALAVMILTATLAGGTLTRADTHTFAEVMRRAHEYAVIDEDHELSTVIARERYQQQWLDAQARTKAERLLMSDFLIFQLPPNEDWLALRDVHEVDGATVEGHEDRLKALFNRPRDPQGNLGSLIMSESGRFNLAPDLYVRTVNVPTFALRFLRPASRFTVAFSKAGEEQLETAAAWVIAYRETKGPTFIGTPEGGDLPAHGRFWIDPDAGTVLRSELIVGGTRRMPARVTIIVTYKRQPGLTFVVPVEMRERYDSPRRPKDDVVVARATYSEFRPFDWRTLVPPTTER